MALSQIKPIYYFRILKGRSPFHAEVVGDERADIQVADAEFAANCGIVYVERLGGEIGKVRPILRVRWSSPKKQERCFEVFEVNSGRERCPEKVDTPRGLNAVKLENFT